MSQRIDPTPTQARATRYCPRGGTIPASNWTDSPEMKLVSGLPVTSTATVPCGTARLGRAVCMDAAGAGLALGPVLALGAGDGVASGPTAGALVS